MVELCLRLVYKWVLWYVKLNNLTRMFAFLLGGKEGGGLDTSIHV